MRAARAYGNTDRQTAVMVSNPVGLVILLYEKLLTRLAEVKRAFAAQDIQGRAQAITKSIELIDVGLVSSLDHRKGGDIAMRLNTHYEIWIAKLFSANMKASEELVSEVEEEVRMIKSAWVELNKENRT